MTLFADTDPWGFVALGSGVSAVLGAVGYLIVRVWRQKTKSMADQTETTLAERADIRTDRSAFVRQILGRLAQVEAKAEEAMQKLIECERRDAANQARHDEIRTANAARVEALERQINDLSVRLGSVIGNRPESGT